MTSGTDPRTTPSWPDLPEAARDVLLEVLVHGAMPRAEIAARLHLSRPTLTRVTRTLVLHGLLVEGGTQLRSSTGRPSEMLHVRGDSHHFLGVKLTADRLYAAVTDLTATVVDTTDHPLRSTDPADVVAQIADLATGVPPVTAIGVTLGGIVHRGVVTQAEFLGWVDVPLRDDLVAATAIPTAVDNDVQALTSAEHWFGAGAGLDSMVLVTVGAGVGFGIVVDGKLVRGAHGLPPRIAHILVDPTGPRCGYGHRGCASSYLMTHVMLRQLDGEPTYEQAVARARAGDPAAKEVFDNAGYALGVLIGTAANFLDPRKILLTGDGLPLYEVSSDRVADGIRASYEADPALIDLDVQPFDFTEWARSGAALAIRAALTQGI
ncbi:putative NBD/HSP70 family sugar kinase [Saccharothrix carnea]|uniref:Putative NBD/HSP70 family sugar kinase n=1 Tax=Saccharothrix carnea TaxID=1280637 RepID=A0A2P8I628_SACCR|nr:ROK family transcriptional regulator [Saccharothrix carnea]PSL53924.1 putative NBD/HSP70 family sugar kinase [Saccharothrix carnea]